MRQLSFYTGGLMIKGLFSLEEGILYYCSAFDQSQIFRLHDKRLQILTNESFVDYPVIDLRWFYEELPDQRNKCPTCHRSMVVVKNGYMFLNRFYTGLYCRPCNITIEGPDVPKLAIGAAE